MPDRTSPPAGPAAVAVRLARPEEYGRVGALTVTAYRAAGFLGDDNGYATELADAAARAASADLLVAVASGGEVVGTATLIRDPASPLAELARAGDAEIRMLAVAPGAQRGGIGQALVEDCVARATRAGLRRLVLCSRPDMTTAHRIYAWRGFRRAPELDWEPEPGFLLIAYVLDLAAAEPAPYCDRCGEPADAGDHRACHAQRELEPPRYCPRCRRRMVVQVTPRGWRARCAEHGVSTGAGAG